MTGTHASTRRPLLIAAAACAGLCLVGLLLDPTSTARWMSHPARLGPAGELPATTITGAQWWRWALVALPWMWLGAWFAATRLGRPTPDAPVPTPPGRAAFAPLVGIVALGILLRVPLLSTSLWYDEIVAFAGYSLHGPGPIVGNYYSQANHILSQLLIWASSSIVGADEFGLRLPALVAGIVATVGVWGAVREIDGERPALFAAAAMAAMPIHVLADTDARGYAIVIAFAALALWSAARARRTGSPMAWAALSLWVALAAWAHLVAVVFAVGLGATWTAEALLRRDRRPLAGVAALAAGAAATVLLYAPVLPDILARRSQFGGSNAGVPSLLGPETWHALIGLGGAWVWWAALPGGALALLGAFDLLPRRPARTWAVAALAGFPLTYLLAGLAGSWLYARFLLFVVPGVAILIAAGCERLSRRRPALGWSAMGLVAAVGAAHLLTLPPRQPLREALVEARLLAGDGRPVGVIGLVDNPLAYYGLLQRVELVDFGDRGARLEATPPARWPAAIVVLYPDSLPASRSAALTAAGYVAARSLPGWVDWGAGRIEVWARRPSGALAVGLGAHDLLELRPHG